MIIIRHTFKANVVKRVECKIKLKKIIYLVKSQTMESEM